MRTRLLRSCAGLSVALFLAAPSVFAGGARIVNAPGLPPFTNLQEAVDAAADGDTIVIAAGTYAGFTIQDKSLQVVGLQSQIVLIEGSVQVVGLAAERSVLISNVRIKANTAPVLSGAGLVVSNSQGHVRIDACHITGGAGAAIQPQAGGGGHAVVLQGSPQVAFNHSNLQGGKGGDGSSCSGCSGGDGGHGVRINLSHPAFYESVLEGGVGGDGDSRGGRGGDGAWLGNTWMFAAGESFVGGAGGNGLAPGASSGGNGGAGVLVNGGATAQLFDSPCMGGAGGAGAANGLAGPGVGGGGNAVQHPGKACDLRSWKTMFDGSTMMIAAKGTPGDAVWIRMSWRPQFRYQDSLPGVHLVSNSHVPLVAGGIIPPDGELILALHAPQLVGEQERVLYMQGFGVDALGEQWLGCPMQVVVLDQQGQPDCNGNQQCDLADVYFASSADCGPNLVPDECDPDCDANGVPDDCDLGSGTHPDCNGNAIPDACDIASGFSPDANANGIPDECES
jgi:hypothetical protein